MIKRKYWDVCMTDNITPEESKKKYIRIFLNEICDNERGFKDLKYDRNDEYATYLNTGGYEDLDLREDATKIQLYLNCNTITMMNNQTYEVVKREFMPCIPVCLYLYLRLCFKSMLKIDISFEYAIIKPYVQDWR